MNRDNKRMVITTFSVAVISVLLAFHLKQHYDQITNENHASEGKINVKNKSVRIYQNLTYNKVFSDSKLDIITPIDMSPGAELPVIF